MRQSHSLYATAKWTLLALFLTFSLLCAEGPCHKEEPCTVDSDGDGVCDENDQCPGYDDNENQDGDQFPDSCDVCPDDPLNDANGDSLCDSGQVTLSAPLPLNRAVLARNANNVASLTIAGSVAAPGYERISLLIERDGQSWQTRDFELVYQDGSAPFSLNVSLPAGLISYNLRLSLKKQIQEFFLAERHDLAVGDHILIQGQSNAVAGDYWGENLANQSQSRWIRSFGTDSLDGNETAADLTWDIADGGAIHSHAAVGTWALRLAELIMEREQVAVAVLNGAVGGTLISQHLRNNQNPEDLSTIYGRFLFRARKADMAAHARYLIWYQGESDGYGWGSSSNAYLYPTRFEALRAAWKSDFPALEKIYEFQVHQGCGLDHPRDASLILDFYDQNGQRLGGQTVPFLATSGWAEYQLPVEAPPSTTAMLYAFLPSGVGPIYFDDASITDPAKSQFLLNPGFENGLRFPDNWESLKDGNYVWADSGSHAGKKAMRLDSVSAVSMLYQAAGASAGTTYLASIWARAEVTDSYLDVREVLRQLPQQYDDLVVMSTNAAPDHDGCHYRYAGYRELGDRIARQVMRDFYNGTELDQIDPPNAVAAYFSDDQTIVIEVTPPETEITLQAGAEREFFIDGARVVAGAGDGATIILHLDQPTTARKLSYLSHAGTGPDVVNGRGIGLLAFYELTVQE